MQKIIINSPKHGTKEVLVDDEDFEKLNQFTWCAHKIGNKFYAIRKYPRTNTILMHRLLMNVTDRTNYVDHIDGNGLNNQKSNLRIANHSENLCNRSATRVSKSKFKGVTWVSSHKLWRAQIQKDKIQRPLGYFKNEEDAARAYDEAAVKIHGNFAKLNF